MKSPAGFKSGGSGSSTPVPTKKIKPNQPLIPWSKKNGGTLKDCNGWSWVGEGREEKVHLNVSMKKNGKNGNPLFQPSPSFFAPQNEDPPVFRICYPAMKHSEGDVVKPRHCILLASGHRKKDLPFVAKVTALYENPEDGTLVNSCGLFVIASFSFFKYNCFPFSFFR